MTQTPPPVPLTDWAVNGDAVPLTLHASAVACDGRAVLICGASGSGKSRLALALIGLGARLICDDICVVAPGAEDAAATIEVQRPASALPAIEVRGVGLLASGPVVARADLVAVVDLDRSETARVPPARSAALGRRHAPLICGANRRDLPYDLIHLLRYGWANL